MTATALRANVSVNVLRLLTFGGLGIEADNGSTTPRLRRPRLALLAVLAVAGERGVSREKLWGLFWPEADEDRARASLRQNLYALRHDLGRDVVRSIGSTLSLDPALLGADVIDFYAALAASSRERAISLARAPFLDGFYLPGASAFERWVEEERNRIAAATIAALLALASEASRARQPDAAAEWWRQLTERDPLNGRFAVGYIKLLAARGDRASALAFARQHEAVVRRELQADPDPEVLQLAAGLRAAALPNGTSSTSPDGGHGMAPATPEPTNVTMHESAGVGASPLAVPIDPRSSREQQWRAPSRSRRVMSIAAAVGAVVLATGWLARESGWLSAATRTPTMAVGFIREDSATGDPRMSRVLTDMIATDLARVEGLAVLSNSRLIELLRTGQDSAAGYAEAARRAGASELLEGQLVTLSHDTLALEMRRVELRTGIVKDVYRVRASNRYALADSLVQSVAQRFRLETPRGSIAEATTSSPTAYRLYEEGLRAYFQADVKTAQRLMNAALAEDSSFAMAAYWVVKIGKDVWDPVYRQDMSGLRPMALRLAARAPDRERLMITAELLTDDLEPRAVAVAETLTTRYQSDPRAFSALGKVYWMSGEWTKAMSALERAIALDSAAEREGGVLCMLCEDFDLLGRVYMWADSLPGIVHLANRYRALRPKASSPYFLLGLVGQRSGDSATAYGNYQRLAELGGTGPGYEVSIDFGLEAYDRAERRLTNELSSSIPGAYDNAAWRYVILLRNQGRIREAAEFFRSGSLPGLPPPPTHHDQNAIVGAILALAQGVPQVAADTFGYTLHLPLPTNWSEGSKARHRAWNGTLYGMALAALGDTVHVRALADSVEQWGRGSLYGRDRRTHHYLRGMVHEAGGRFEDAAREFQAAIHSPTMGFTRVNYELARCLIRLRRPQEAVAALQPALRADIDAGAVYLTHTEVHELLAQAFDSAGMTDSAAVHYRAVARAWRRADPEFGPRREAAQRWLARHLAATGRTATR